MTELMIRDNAGQYQLASPEHIAAAARHLRETQWRPEKQVFTNPRAVRDFLDLQLAEREQEVF
jgi:DNA repair protein RadC